MCIATKFIQNPFLFPCNNLFLAKLAKKKISLRAYDSFASSVMFQISGFFFLFPFSKLAYVLLLTYKLFTSFSCLQTDISLITACRAGHMTHRENGSLQQPKQFKCCKLFWKHLFYIVKIICTAYNTNIFFSNWFFNLLQHECLTGIVFEANRLTFL